MSHYFPILKTTISEMRALSQINFSEITNIVPILELTRSRKTKNFPDGNMAKKIDELEKILGTTEFILDITSDENLSSMEIEALFDDNNSFENWTSFIHHLKHDRGLNVIPTVQGFDDTPVIDITNQLKELHKITGKVACRLYSELHNLPIAKNIIDEICKYTNSIVIIDAEYINTTETVSYQNKINDTISLSKLIPNNSKGLVVLASSSFPSSIVSQSGNKVSGSIALKEVDFWEIISHESKRKFFYADYAAIHPFRNEPGIYTIIPRIDFPMENEVFFQRYRREDGGYELCAKKIVNQPEFRHDNHQCWGISEIESASIGNVNGKSPSYWISVRANIHITRKAEKVIP